MSTIQKVLIVGGGSSGWMTATILHRRLPQLEITLIEASDIPIIGVGESTNPVIRYFHQIAGIDEKSFMRGANAAFKIAIRFEGFDRPHGVFFHPFGQPPRPDAALFVPQAQAQHASYQLANTGTLFSKELAYAYQIDAGLYGQYLKERCKREGVRHVVDRVLRADLAPDASVECIRTERSGDLRADLYIDCSGFRAFLLDKTLHEPFQPVARYLPNDRAIAARVPYQDQDRELRTFTNCTALSAGWVWEIPLWSRIGTGYVYSSAFLAPSAAEAEFRAYLGADRARNATFNHIEIRAGRHNRAWVGNCVGIGVSYGFLEPLESTGLSLTQVALIDLAREIADGATSQAKDRFNDRQSAMFDATRDFIMAHFVLTSREDTPYWRHIRHLEDLPESLVDVLDRAIGGSYASVDALRHTFYDKLNWNLILSGMGLFGSADTAAAADAPVLPRQTLRHSQYLREQVHGEERHDLDDDLRDVSTSEHPMWFPTW